MTASFVHLSLHTEYSLCDSVVRIKPLMQALSQAGMPAVALTDQGNLFALVKFYQAAIQAGIKPIIGVDAYIYTDNPTAPQRLLLLCQNTIGYRNLTQLISRSYLEHQHNGRPFFRQEWLQNMSDGLLALSGERAGDIGQALLNQQPELAEMALKRWLKLFPGRFYIEVQRTGQPHQAAYLEQAVALAAQYQVPLVATNDVRFISQQDFAAHEARVCIHAGRTLNDPRRARDYTEQQYLRSPAEMAELFADLPSAVSNTLAIAKRCNLQLTLGESFLPDFPVPANTSLESHFIAEAQAGLAARLEYLQRNQAWPAERIAAYQQRLETELGVINAMGFSGYFLIVADFVKWAKANGVPVGPGRGSGAGSLVAYAMSITDLDPIHYDLLFERFLNPERVSLPDFDIDFCMDGRDRVIEYVAERYGRDKVSQIITYGSMAAKAVVRDVGRVMGHPYGFVDNIAKLIPFEIGMTLDKALQDSEELRQAYEQEEDIKALLDMAKSLEGLARNAGKHAGGVVIAPSKLTDFTPLYCEENGQGVVTQLDKDDVESIGLVKFDFLGLRTLTIIASAVQAINQRQAEANQSINISDIPLDDKKTFDLLKAQATTAVFQLESRGMKDLIKRLQPDSFDDIVALVALFRPGPLQSGMVDDFIERKHGKSAITYVVPALEPILKSTYGVILYQEQVMQIAQVLAGYSLGEADLLRRAMGKKKPAEMAKQRQIFVDGAVANKIEESVAVYIFDLMEKFAGYGFNKSHSVAYALLSYQTAWLKAHYPAEFMAAVLSADMDNTDKVVRLIDECHQLELAVIPPDINTSGYTFTVDAQNRIVYGLGAIKGLGAAAVDAIVTSRQQDGAYSDLYDFCCRVDVQKLNKRAQESLIRSGAMDSLQQNRATLAANLPNIMKMAERRQQDISSGQIDIFGMVASVGTESLTVLQAQDEWDEAERLKYEKETLGLYLTGHPIERYLDELMLITGGKSIAQHIDYYEAKQASHEYKDIEVTLAGLLVSLRVKNTRSGKMAFLVLDDRSARIDVLIRAEDYDRHAAILILDNILIVNGRLGTDEFSGGYRVRLRSLYNLDQARQHFAQRLVLMLDSATTPQTIIEIKDILTAYTPGPCPVWIQYLQPGLAKAELQLGEQWQIRPTETLLQRLTAVVGEVNVKLDY